MPILKMVADLENVFVNSKMRQACKLSNNFGVYMRQSILGLLFSFVEFGRIQVILHVNRSDRCRF